MLLCVVRGPRGVTPDINITIHSSSQIIVMSSKEFYGFGHHSMRNSINAS